MKYTNLQLVQTILASLDGDEVNSVSDTAESRQVLDILRTVYYDIVALGELTRDDIVFQLEPSLNPDRPVTMYIPDSVSDLRWVKYDYQTAQHPVVNYQEIQPMPWHEFVQMVTNFDATQSNVLPYTFFLDDGGLITFYCKTDGPPKFYSTPDDSHVIFDSYTRTLETTLQKSKTLCFGQQGYVWRDTDDFVPPLDSKQHQRLLHEAKSLAFAELKQSQHVKAEKTARDIRINQQSSKTKIPTQTAYEQITSMGRIPHRPAKPTGRY